MIFEIISIILFNLLFYSRCLFFGRVSDDRLPKDHKRIAPKNFLHNLWLGFKWHTQTSDKVAHAVNLIIHTLNCILIYFAFGRNNLSFLTALLFAINPVNTQGGAIWLSGRHYALGATFVLLMFLFPLISPIFYFLGLSYGNFNVLVSPLFFLPTKYWFWGLLFLGGFIFKRKIIKTQIAGKEVTATPVMKEIKPYKLILFFKTFGYYTQLCLFPLRLGFYHKFLYFWGMSKQDNKECLRLNWSFWKGLIITLAVVVLIIFNWNNFLGFGLFWWTMGIFIWCNLITIQQAIGERYAYLPNCGLILALAYIIIKLPHPFNIIAITTFFVFYAFKLWFYTRAYKDEKYFAQHNLYDFPDFHQNYVWLGLLYQEQGRRYETLGAWLDALELRPLDFKTLFNTGQILGEIGHLQDAWNTFEKAKQSLVPETAEKELLAVIEKRQAVLKEAIEKSQIATQNQIIEMAKKIKKGEKLF